MHCRAPFSAISISSKGYNVCCQYPFVDSEYDFNSDNFQNLRRSMILQDHNDLNIRCKQCTIRNIFNNERLMENSYLHNFLNYDIDSGFIDDYKISHVHLGLGNKCTSACKTCNKNNSNVYGKIYNNIDYNRQIVEYRDIITKNKDYINELTLIGGEIFLYKEDIEFLIDTLNDDVELTIFTNGTIFDKDLIERLSRKFSLIIDFSVDGFNERNNYIRPGCDYDTVKKNILSINEIATGNSCISITVSILNIMDIDNIIDGLMSDFNDNITISINPVLYPYHYNINILPLDVKNKIAKKISYIKAKYPSIYTIDLLTKTMMFNHSKDIEKHREILADDIVHKDSVFSFDTKKYLNDDVYKFIFKKEDD